MPPWTMPNTSCPGAGVHARQRSAQSDVRRTASSSLAVSTPAGGHSSNAIAMSDPRRRWISIASSGVNRCCEPSYTDRKSTPESSIVAVSRSEKTWYPPESVRIGAVPSHEPVQAAEPVDPLRTRPEVEVVGVPEHDLGPQVAQLSGHHGLHRGLRADGHEDGRLDRAVGRLEHPSAGGAVGGDDVELPCHAISIASPNE